MNAKWGDAELARARKMLAAGMSMADVSRYFGRGRSSLSSALEHRMVGRVAEGTGPENQRRETVRPFESDTIRQ